MDIDKINQLYYQKVNNKMNRDNRNISQAYLKSTLLKESHPYGGAIIPAKSAQRLDEAAEDINKSATPTFFARVDLEIEHRNKSQEYDYSSFQQMDVSYKIYFDFVKSGIRSISVYDVKVEPFTIYDDVDDIKPINVDFGGKEIESEVPDKITLPLIPYVFRLVVDGTTPIAEESKLIF